MAIIPTSEETALRRQLTTLVAPPVDKILVTNYIFIDE